MTDNVGFPSWCVRGAQVVCAIDWAPEHDGAIIDPLGRLTAPIKGQVYTIRDKRISWVPEYGEAIAGILLVEIENPTGGAGSCNGNEMAWDVRGFAPVQRTAAKAARRAEEPLDA